jgi:hypothetical protein
MTKEEWKKQAYRRMADAADINQRPDIWALKVMQTIIDIVADELERRDEITRQR